MDKVSDPLEAIIDFAWSCGADRFWINNAKDELKKLKNKIKEWSEEVYRANEFAVEQTNQYLDACNQIQKLKDSLNDPVAYATINDRGDMYDLRFSNNPYHDQSKVIPLYRLHNPMEN